MTYPSFAKLLNIHSTAVKLSCWFFLSSFNQAWCSTTVDLRARRLVQAESTTVKIDIALTVAIVQTECTCKMISVWRGQPVPASSAAKYEYYQRFIFQAVVGWVYEIYQGSFW